ncbi:GAP family protein [Nocardiopsis composta]|uniref:Cytochrome c biogenesis protein CcdA n=1 Tax=Nocardiopsis composta TaxID=157465 RepID=A0A7W8QHQ4_9ACTN|nr:GAP family protein [Nocardiopsis composta]MBB5430561.1 cytochrome c biogenesis protein CcdA [Nocardiopsis composta]
MTSGLAAILAGLALLDSMSVGTLFIPVWLMLAPGRIRPLRFAAYLATVAVFYFLLGAVLSLGAGAALPGAADPSGGPAAAGPSPLLRSAIGAVLLVGGFVLERRERNRQGHPRRLVQWRERAMTGSGGAAALMALAVAAALLEAATLLPFLGAIGIMAGLGLSAAATAAGLAMYCLIMVAPAVALFLGRLFAHARIAPYLERFDRWSTRNGGKVIAWALQGLGGFLLGNGLLVHFLG